MESWDAVSRRISRMAASSSSAIVRQFSVSPTRLNSLLNGAAHFRHAAQIHAHILVNGHHTRFTFLTNNLINLYANCGFIGQSLDLFATVSDESKTVVTWTSVITQLSRFNRAAEALGLFKRMRGLGIDANVYSFSVVLHACKESGDILLGNQVHSLVSKHGLERDAFVGSALLDMYGECECIDCAEKVFDEMPNRNVVAWNSMVVGFLKNGLFDRAIEVFKMMLEDALVVPSQVSVSSVLCACANYGVLEFGKLVHGLVLKLGLIMMAYVRNSLMDMYCKRVAFEDAVKMFEETKDNDVVAWNVMAIGCVQNTKFEEAYSYYGNMRRDGTLPDEASLSTATHASAQLAAFNLGTMVHTEVIKLGFSENRCVSGSLITMYSKCGRLVDASNLFNRIKDPNVVCWTAIISAYQHHGCCNLVIDSFEEMLREGIRPESITFVSLLSACSHAGRLEEGFLYFGSMSCKHDIQPGHAHYACMVDLLGRAGRLNEALRLIDSMTIKPESSVWGALLGACRKHGNLKLGKEVAEKLFLIEPNNPGNYLILSNMYTSLGKQDLADHLRKRMGNLGVLKEIGCSWIDVKNKTSVFTANDESHTMTNSIHRVLQTLKMFLDDKDPISDEMSILHDHE